MLGSNIIRLLHTKIKKLYVTNLNFSVFDEYCVTFVNIVNSLGKYVFWMVGVSLLSMHPTFPAA
jgi:hypothetical protein